MGPRRRPRAERARASAARPGCAPPPPLRGGALAVVLLLLVAVPLPSRCVGGGGGAGDGAGVASWGVGAGSAVPLIAPVEGSATLAVTEEGAALLRSGLGGGGGADPLVAPVVVIGPYRSGKSWLLNQLLGVDCEHGFGVGHKRHTQTRGLWVWSEAVRRSGGAAPGGGGREEGAEGAEGAEVGEDGEDGEGGEEEVHVLFVDTEGFESTRKAAYDDRIFILSTVMASVLIYNLPEAVREADVEKVRRSPRGAADLARTQRSPRGAEARRAAMAPLTLVSVDDDPLARAQRSSRSPRSSPRSSSAARPPPRRTRRRMPRRRAAAAAAAAASTRRTSCGWCSATS